MTQRSVMTGSIFELSQCRIVWVLPLKISPACYGDLFHNRCLWQGTSALAISQFLQTRKCTGGQCVLHSLTKEVIPPQPQAG